MSEVTITFFLEEDYDIQTAIEQIISDLPDKVVAYEVQE